MGIGNVGSTGRLGITPNTGVAASAYASVPSPSGYRWDFVTYRGERVTFRGAPVVTLVRVS